MPKITLENEKSLSLDLIKALHRLLIQRANSLKGREMVFDLCQEVQDFLYQHNKPPTITKSFYDQRLENRLIIEKEQEKEVVCDEKRKIEDQLV